MFKQKRKKNYYAFENVNKQFNDDNQVDVSIPVQQVKVNGVCLI